MVRSWRNWSLGREVDGVGSVSNLAAGCSTYCDFDPSGSDKES